MGYALYITRKEHWFDEHGDDIALDEWSNYVETAPDMQFDDSFDIKNATVAVWVGYSEHNKNGNAAWFGYSEGNICVNNPDEEIIEKMLLIAKELHAQVQGDDGELYHAGNRSEWRIPTIKYEVTTEPISKKWWRFWK